MFSLLLSLVFTSWVLPFDTDLQLLQTRTARQMDRHSSLYARMANNWNYAIFKQRSSCAYFLLISSWISKNTAPFGPCSPIDRKSLQHFIIPSPMVLKLWEETTQKFLLFNDLKKYEILWQSLSVSVTKCVSFISKTFVWKNSAFQ